MLESQKPIDYLRHVRCSKFTEWESMFTIIPRKINGKWYWLSRIERRFVYIPDLTCVVPPIGSGAQYRVNSSEY